MIGTILISLLGYGGALFFVFAFIVSMRKFAAASADSYQEERFAIAAVISFLLAFALAALTRLLGGL
ncbi:hypothetical protein [Chelatococcus sp. XZ-Ab1]|uniref:hypothetical protein n=1 Tax=Chelatococcus sp. XZ-Ab1 TaxID=3034027 RepID=UPI0023E38641|nr:hypothetical protein [Chelatococcus sp. XZ-Ab1]